MDKIYISVTKYRGYNASNNSNQISLNIKIIRKKNIIKRWTKKCVKNINKFVRKLLNKKLINKYYCFLCTNLKYFFK